MLSFRLIVGFLLCWLVNSAFAEVLPAKEVFIPRVVAVSQYEINVGIEIKPKRYIYRERLFSVTSDNPDLIIEDITLSPGSTKTDDFFGQQSVWYGGKDTASIDITYQNPKQLSSASIVIRYQGCHDGEICYPPETIVLPLNLPVTTTAAKSNSPSSLFKQPLSKSSSLLRPAATAKSAADLIVGVKSNNALLPEDEAFPFTTEMTDSTTVVLRWQIADGYYLYQDKIKITAENDNLAQVQLSQGEPHIDEFFGEQNIYRHDASIAQVYLKKSANQQTLQLSFQGCADKGICYPVMQRVITIDSGNIDTQVSTELAANAGTGGVVDNLTKTLKDNVLLGMGLLVLAGIALALTPCVLPMLPILLGIITNRGQTSKSRSAVLSSAYVLGMATMLAVFGLVVAKTGINIQIIFQRPLWLILFATIFMLMGMAMLGVFSLAMPNGVQTTVTRWQNKFQTNRVRDVFVVGALSSLIVGPCIAPPLIAILAFISTTNDSLLGAVYLFSLGIGMGLPLILFATLVTQIPKTGELSRLVTRILAMLMFAVGLWLLARLIPGPIGLMIWGVWLLVMAYWFWRSQFVKNTAKRIAQVLAAVCLVVGSTWIVGGLIGNSNPLKPFTTVIHLPFKSVNTLDELQSELAASQQPVMFDLYADWCVSCQEIEHFTLTDTRVVDALSDWTLLKLDITQTNAEHRKMLAELGLIGPPALLFYNNGKEIKSARNIGAISADELLEKIKNLR